MEEDGFFDYSGVMHCAVYALVRKGIVVYIGQSKSVAQRLATHCSKRKGGVRRSGLYSNQIKVGFAFDAIWVRPCMLAELNDLEAAMIKKYQPKHNQKHMPPKPTMSLEMLLDMMPPPVVLSNEPRRASWRR